MKFFKQGLVAATIGSLVLLAGCTGESTGPDNDTINRDDEVAAVIETYTAVTDEVFNHGHSTEELSQANIDVTVALGDNGNNYAAALTVIEPFVSLDHVYVGSGSDEDKIIGAMRVFNRMLSNTVGDTVSVKIDPEKVKISAEGDVAHIYYSGIKFSSENNAETGLATMLNEQLSLADKNYNHVVLHHTADGWVVDMTTFLPEVFDDNVGAGEGTVEENTGVDETVEEETE